MSNVLLDANTTFHIVDTSPTILPDNASLVVQGDVVVQKDCQSYTLAIGNIPTINTDDTYPDQLIGISSVQNVTAIFEPISNMEVPINTGPSPYIGSVIIWPALTPPNGHLLKCDGQLISRMGYLELFQVIGEVYGPGDGSTTFNVPDYRGMFLRGTDDSKGVDPDASSRAPRPDFASGDVTGTIQQYSTAIPQTTQFVTTINGEHTHTLPNAIGVADITIGSSYVGTTHSLTPIFQTDNAGSHIHSVIGGGDLETRPSNIYVEYWMIYK